jgi:hypothetical protein
LIWYIFAGQLVVASLLSRNIKSRLLLRDPEKAVSLFGKQDESVLQVHHDLSTLFFMCSQQDCKINFCQYDFIIHDRFTKATREIPMIWIHKCLRSVTFVSLNSYTTYLFMDFIYFCNIEKRKSKYRSYIS